MDTSKHVADDTSTHLVDDRDVSDKNLNKTIKSTRVTFYKIAKTVCLVLTFMVMGMYIEVVGPTLPNLMQQVGVNFEVISQALVTHSVGYFFSSLIGGILTDRFSGHVELLLCIALVMACVGTGLVPWVFDLKVLALLLFLRGLSQGFVDTYGHFLCMRLWRSKAAAPLHAMHFGFGVGAFTIPLIVRPFLSEIHPRYNETTQTYTDTSSAHRNDVPHDDLNQTHDTLNSSNFQDQDFYNSSSSNSSRILVPYSICASLAAIFAVLFIVFYTYERKCAKETSPKPKNSDVKPSLRAKLHKTFSVSACTNGEICFGIMLFLLMFFLAFNQVGCENAIGRFIYAYATEGHLAFSVDQAATLNSMFWMLFTCGRGLSMIVARWMPQKALLITQSCLSVVCGVVLSVWGYDVPIVIWVFTSTLGLSMSSVLPAGLAWANCYVILRGIVLAVVFSGGAAGGIFYQWLTGYLFQHYGPHTLMYIVMGYSLVLASLVLLMQLLVCNKRDRFHQEITETYIPEDTKVAFTDGNSETVE